MTEAQGAEVILLLTYLLEQIPIFVGLMLGVVWACSWHKT